LRYLFAIDPPDDNVDPQWMCTARALADGLASRDASALVLAVEDAERQLKAGALSEEAALAVGRALAAQVRHERSDVRKAIAWASRYVPDAVFPDVIRPLREDANQFVKRAAERAYDERSKRRRSAAARDAQSADVRALRRHIEDTWDGEAARAADRLRDRALAEFVEGMHHELVKVGTTLRLDLDDLRREARRRAGDELGVPADQVLAKLDALLAIVQSARAQLRYAEPAFREERLRALVSEQIALLRARLDDARRARLRVEVSVDEGLAIEVDRALLGQALANVLQNAVEAHPAAGEGAIEVRVTAEERLSGTCVLVVSDAGCGMSAPTLERMGEPFLSTKGTGRGLGMLNVRRVVEGAHGGTVLVKSCKGEGTSVTFELPRKQ
jgi:signal transduction histidine kinase